MLKSFLAFLSYSNIFIAIAAASQTALYIRLHNHDLSIALLAFIFFSTIIVYHFAVGYPSKTKTLDVNARIQWLNNHSKLVHALMLTSLIACIILITQLDHQLEIMIVGAFALLYNFRFKQLNFYGFRSIPLVKIISIALVWVLVCNVYPLLIYNYEFNKTELVRMVLKFMWMIALTIPFDIRDLYTDRENNLITIPSLLGNNKAYMLSYSLFVLSSLGALIFLGLTVESLTIVISSLLAILLIYKNRNSADDFDYLIKLDGLLIVEFLIFYGINILI